ncbi:MAG: hypothetical protein VYC39_03625 [Myxococcota bacterium]|jgi:cytochrome c oxidase subunit 2|nr:hypothetical protein [Myxococcota bacterium]
MKFKHFSNKLTSVLVWIWTMAITGVAWADVPKEEGWGMPTDASLDGHRVDWLINITNVFITILFVIMVIWIVWAVLAHNEKHTADYDHGDSKHHVMVALSISAFIFLVVDGNLFYNAAKDLTQAFWNFEKAEAAANHVKIEVQGRQWIWEARYEGPDGKFNTQDDAVTTNDIRVPVNAPIIIQVTSPDVIHAISFPNFRVKVDAVPGSVNQLWLQATQTGQFEISCGQHCGQAHYKMAGRLTVMEEADFKEWVAQKSRDSKQIYDENAQAANWGWTWRKY